MNRIFQIIGLLLLIQTGTVEACSFARYQMFPPENPLSKRKGAVPDAPKVSYKVKRGYSDQFDSCADTGIVVLKIEQSKHATGSVGYLIEVIENSTGQMLFPEHAIYGDEKGGADFVFPWVDGASDVQEPLNIEIKIYRVSENWVRSNPTNLSIKHYGRM